MSEPVCNEKEYTPKELYEIAIEKASSIKTTLKISMKKFIGKVCVENAFKGKTSVELSCYNWWCLTKPFDTDEFKDVDYALCASFFDETAKEFVSKGYSVKDWLGNNNIHHYKISWAKDGDELSQ